MATNTNESMTVARYVWGIALLVLSVFFALGLFSYDWADISVLRNPPMDPPCNMIGVLGAWLSFLLFMALGLAAYIVPLLFLTFGLILVRSRRDRVWPAILWGSLLLLGTAFALELSPNTWARACDRLNIVDVGGVCSRVLMQSVLIRWLSPVGAGILVVALIAVSAFFLVGLDTIKRLGGAIATASLACIDRLRNLSNEQDEKKKWIEKEAREIEKERRRLEKSMLKQKRLEAREAAEREKRATPKPVPANEPPEEKPERQNLDREPTPRKEKRRKSTPPPAMEDQPDDGTERSTYQLPSVTLLDAPPPEIDRGLRSDTATTSRILVETLGEFGIDVEVTNVEQGPVVTRYELLPAPGVRVERISGLSNNLALSLKATSVRVQAPIPGKGVIGVEVPNLTSQMVSLREILEGERWQSGKAKLPLALGQDVGGNDLVADLAAMPHLLIAGATGAGKTVCMNSVLAGLLMARTPDELRLLLVDPKIVEFSVYNHLPHLIAPVITDAKKVALGLRWAIAEMERRYKLFAKAGVRNIEGFNNRVVATQPELFNTEEEAPPEEPEKPDKVPYIVIVIDELADLMLADQAEIENCVARLAQLSRAVGIHMILSTQRPSVNVITGTIKANFPARIAFQVAQKVDSRTILDQVGADKLLGRGDMLFLPPGTSKLIRAQGALSTDNEIRLITDAIKQQAEPTYEMDIKEKLEKAATSAGGGGGEDDELLSQSIEIIRETGRASTSSLQRRLRIGYTRAARIVDILEERGIVGPPRGSDPREILIDLDGDIPNNSGEEDADTQEPDEETE